MVSAAPFLGARGRVAAVLPQSTDAAGPSERPCTGQIDTIAKETGTVLEAMVPGANGRVEVRGTTWSARNVGTTPLSKGARCTVVREERLTLLVNAEEALR